MNIDFLALHHRATGTTIFTIEEWIERRIGTHFGNQMQILLRDYENARIAAKMTIHRHISQGIRCA